MVKYRLKSKGLADNVCCSRFCLLTGREEKLMKKKIAALAVVMMMMATSVPALAIQNGQQDVAENENCLEFFSDLFENIGEKIRKILGLEEDESEESDSCPGCTFEVESADTKVWLAYIGSEYFQFEVTPVEGGLKNVRIKKLDNLNKVIFEVPNVQFIEIYGENIYFISANDSLMAIDVTSTRKVKIISNNATQFVWVGVDGNNRLAFVDDEGKTTIL